MKPVGVEKHALLLLHGESLPSTAELRGFATKACSIRRLRRRFVALNTRHRTSTTWPQLTGFGIAENHPFIDDNKRAAFLAAGLFLVLNRWHLEATQVDATRVMLSVADGSLGESEFAASLRMSSKATLRPRRS